MGSGLRIGTFAPSFLLLEMNRLAAYPALTAHQERVYRFLEQQHAETGLMPSVREIQRHFHFASQNQAVSVLQALEKKGMIARQRRKARGLSLLSHKKAGKPQAALVPVLGTIPAGYPDLSTEQVLGHLQVDTRLFGSAPAATVFALQVRGDSMVGAAIHDGDYAFCQSTQYRSPSPNDIVAALIDGETTLKRYLVLENAPCLKAENPKYPDLVPARELVIQGVFLGLLRGIKHIADD